MRDLSSNSKLIDAYGVWIATVKRKRQGTTVRAYEGRWNVINEHLGNRRLRDITVPLVDRFFDTLEDLDYSVSTRRGIRSVLNSILALAVRYSAIKVNPVRDAGRIEGRPRKPVRALTVDEVCTLLATMDNDASRELAEMTRFMLGTGVRIGEMLAVRWEDVNLETGQCAILGNVVREKGKGVVRHEGKTSNAIRLLTLPRATVEMLRRIKDRREGYRYEDEPVFCDASRRYRDPNKVWTLFRKSCDTAGFDWVTPHVFRKTAATLLDEAGLSARQIADQLGHSQISTTQNYYLGRGRDGSEAAETLNRIFEGL